MERTRETTCRPPQRANSTVFGLNKTNAASSKRVRILNAVKERSTEKRSLRSPEEPSHLARALPLAATVPTGRRARGGSICGRVQHHADRYNSSSYYFYHYYFYLINITTDSSTLTISSFNRVHLPPSCCVQVKYRKRKWQHSYSRFLTKPPHAVNIYLQRIRSRNNFKQLYEML